MPGSLQVRSKRITRSFQLSEILLKLRRYGISHSGYTMESSPFRPYLLRPMYFTFWIWPSNWEFQTNVFWASFCPSAIIGGVISIGVGWYSDRFRLKYFAAFMAFGIALSAAALVDPHRGILDPGHNHRHEHYKRMLRSDFRSLYRSLLRCQSHRGDKRCIHVIDDRV